MMVHGSPHTTRPQVTNHNGCGATWPPKALSKKCASAAARCMPREGRCDSVASARIRHKLFVEQP